MTTTRKTHSPHRREKTRTALHLLAMLLALAATACRSAGGKEAEETGPRPLITVTIEPLRYFAEAIAGPQFTVRSMVPKGTSPETYDPTPQQLTALARSTAYLRIGYIGFELSWMERLAANAPHLRIFDTSRGIDLIHDDTHAHTHPSHRESGHTEQEEGEKGHAHGGVEPHVWNSAANARLIAANILQALCALDPDHQALYRQRHDSLCLRIARTDSLCRRLLSHPHASRAFLIYHPALSYFARDYGLRQISIEEGGKEPSPARLKELIDTCRRLKASVIFVQPEFDRRNAAIIAAQTGTRVVDINPLSYDWEEEMLHTAGALGDGE